MIAILMNDEIEALEIARIAAILYPHVKPHSPETRSAIAVGEALAILDAIEAERDRSNADDKGDDPPELRSLRALDL